VGMVAIWRGIAAEHLGTIQKKGPGNGACYKALQS